MSLLACTSGLHLAGMTLNLSKSLASFKKLHSAEGMMGSQWLAFIE
jgi:hypothetical protein